MSKELRQENNEFLLEGNMLPGEQILWQSGTGRFKLLSGANGRSILIKWAITVAVTLGIIGAYAAAATEFRSNVVVILVSPNETCLLLGSKITGEPQKQLRFWAAHPLGAAEDGKDVEGLVFYAIQNADQALRLVSQQLAA